MKTAIYTPIRNELRIVEFINYYLKLGFDYFILFDDNSDIPITKILKDNNFNMNMFSVIQNIYYKDIKGIYSCKHWAELICPVLHKENIDYLLHVDADEFLYSRHFNNIKQIIENYSPFDRLHVNWVCFGGLLKKNESLSLINTFTRSEDFLQLNGKSLVKLSSLDVTDISSYICPHFLKMKSNSIQKDIQNNNFSLEKLNIKTIDAPMYIAHYSHQDIEGYIDRKTSSDLHLEVYYSHIVDKNNRQRIINKIKKYRNEIINSVYYKNCDFIKNIYEKEDVPFNILVNAFVNTYEHLIDMYKIDNNDLKIS